MSIEHKSPQDLTDQKWIPDAFDYANVKDVLDTTYKLELVKRNALSFDGDNDYVSVPDTPDLEFPSGTSATFSLWYKGDWSENTNNGLITKGYHDTSKVFPYYIVGLSDFNTTSGDVRLTFGWVNSSGVNVVSLGGTSDVADGNWHHLVVVVNRTTDTVYLYVDKVQEASATFTDQNEAMASNSDPVVFMNHYNRYTPGIIRDVRIYSRILSSSEVSDLTDGKPVSSTNLVGHWKFDEGTGTTANDSSGNDNDGTITGATWNGASYKDYPPHYGNGYRVSEPLSLDSIKKVKNSNIKWTSTEPTNTDTKIYTAISSSNTIEPNTKEKQTLYLGGATGGTFTLGDGTTNTSALAYNASASTIQTALEGIYGSGLVSVVEDTDFTITFDISIGDSNLEASFTNLTGATDPTLTVSDAVDYKKATSNSTIPGISTNQDLTGKYLWVRQELSTEDADATPRLSTLEVLIETAKKSLAFFKFF